MCLRIQKIIKTRRTYSHSNTCTCNLGLSRLERFLFLLLFVLHYLAFQCFDSMSCALNQTSTFLLFIEKFTLIFQDFSQHCIPNFAFRKHILYMQLSKFHSQKYFFFMHQPFNQNTIVGTLHKRYQVNCSINTETQPRCDQIHKKGKYINSWQNLQCLHRKQQNLHQNLQKFFLSFSLFNLLMQNHQFLVILSLENSLNLAVANINFHRSQNLLLIVIFHHIHSLFSMPNIMDYTRLVLTFSNKKVLKTI